MNLPSLLLTSHKFSAIHNILWQGFPCHSTQLSAVQKESPPLILHLTLKVSFDDPPFLALKETEQSIHSHHPHAIYDFKSLLSSSSNLFYRLKGPSLLNCSPQESYAMSLINLSAALCNFLSFTIFMFEVTDTLSVTLRKLVQTRFSKCF